MPKMVFECEIRASTLTRRNLQNTYKIICRPNLLVAYKKLKCLHTVEEATLIYKKKNELNFLYRLKSTFEKVKC